MNCRICNVKMESFLIETFRSRLEGLICPRCGHWVYDKTGGRKMRKVNEDRVVAMYETGITRPENIALRLGCSARTVRRIIKKRNPSPGTPIDKFLGTDFEYKLWEWHYRIVGSYNAVAFLFGVSRQAVWEKLNSNQEEVA